MNLKTNLNPKRVNLGTIVAMHTTYRQSFKIMTCPFNEIATWILQLLLVYFESYKQVLWNIHTIFWSFSKSYLCQTLISQGLLTFRHNCSSIDHTFLRFASLRNQHLNHLKSKPNRNHSEFVKQLFWQTEWNSKHFHIHFIYIWYHM